MTDEYLAEQVRVTCAAFNEARARAKEADLTVVVDNMGTHLYVRRVYRSHVVDL